MLVDASATQLGTRPSGMIRMALPSAKNRVATTASPTADRGRRGCRNATAIALNVDSEITANISQWPARSGPSTLPARAAPNSVSAATPATSNSSRPRPRPPSPGRHSSTSTANHATPGMVTR